MAGKTADLWRACAWSVGRIDGVDVERDVYRVVFECGEMATDGRHSLFVEFFGRDHADFVFARKIEIVFGVDLAAQAYLQHTAIVEQTFLEGAAERCAVGIFAAEIFVPEIVVSVELNQIDRAAVIFADGAKNRKTDGVVATDTGGARSGNKDRCDSALDAAKGVFDRKRIHRQVAEIGDAIFFKRVELENWIPWTNDRGLNADVARTEARTRAVRSAAVEGDPNDGDFEFFGLRDVRQAAKRGDAGEAGVFEGVYGLGMRELEGALGFFLGHEPEMLGVERGEVN